MRRWVTVLASAIALMACGDDDDNPAADTGDAAASDVSEGDVEADTTEADTTPQLDTSPPVGSCDTTGASDTRVVAGRYFMALELAPLGGLQLFTRVDVVGSDDALLSLEVYAVSSDKSWQSPAPIVTSCNVALDTDGGFVATLPTFFVPGEANPVGASVEVTDMVLSGTLVDTTSFCGTVDGYLPLLDTQLAGSAFKAVADGTESTPPESSCGGGGATEFAPIATCPSLVAGANTMVSAEQDREFQLFWPDVDGGGPLPVVFLLHGLGGSSTGMLQATSWDESVDAEGYILVAADAANNADGSQVNATDWGFIAPAFGADNRDLVFFEDILKCLGEQRQVDTDRVYATGMSAGGLMTTFAAVNRTNIFAAAAPLSGGYNFEFPTAPDHKIPMIVTWGGESDTAVGTDFHAQALALIANLDANDHFHITCDHGRGHEIPDDLTPAIWEFFQATTLGNVDPGWTELPASFPDWCMLPE